MARWNVASAALSLFTNPGVVATQPGHRQLKGAAGVKTRSAGVAAGMCFGLAGGLEHGREFGLQEAEVAHDKGDVGVNAAAGAGSSRAGSTGSLIRHGEPGLQCRAQTRKRRIAAALQADAASHAFIERRRTWLAMDADHGLQRLLGPQRFAPHIKVDPCSICGGIGGAVAGECSAREATRRVGTVHKFDVALGIPGRPSI